MKERSGRDCPAVIEEALDFLIERAAKCEGIFRISPSKAMLTETIAAMDQLKPIKWDSYSEHLVASILKEFLRELPNPVLTNELYEQWMQLAGLLAFFFNLIYFINLNFVGNSKLNRRVRLV